jgi:hypothetical protein
MQPHAGLVVRVSGLAKTRRIAPVCVKRALIGTETACHPVAARAVEMMATTRAITQSNGLPGTLGSRRVLRAADTSPEGLGVSRADDVPV